MMTQRLMTGLMAACLWFSTTGVLASPAQELVMATTDKVVTVLRAQSEIIREDPKKVYSLVKQIILPHFDFPLMSGWVVGKSAWREASDDQKARFINEFQNLLIRTYATALVEFADKEIRFIDERGDAAKGRVLVRTEVSQDGGFPIPIGYSMYAREGVWKVYDVTIDGISIVRNYRSAFASEVQRNGMDQLIAALVERNKQGGR